MAWNTNGLFWHTFKKSLKTKPTLISVLFPWLGRALSGLLSSAWGKKKEQQIKNFFYLAILISKDVFVLSYLPVQTGLAPGTAEWTRLPNTSALLNNCVLIYWTKIFLIKAHFLWLFLHNPWQHWKEKLFLIVFAIFATCRRLRVVQNGCTVETKDKCSGCDSRSAALLGIGILLWSED